MDEGEGESTKKHLFKNDTMIANIVYSNFKKKLKISSCFLFWSPRTQYFRYSFRFLMHLKPCGSRERRDTENKLQIQTQTLYHTDTRRYKRSCYSSFYDKIQFHFFKHTHTYIKFSSLEKVWVRLCACKF